MTIPVPTLSSSGWVTALSEKADFLLSHFFASDKYQTALYGKNVSNLQWLVEQYQKDPMAMSQQLRSAVETYLSRYYDIATAQVSVTDPDKDGSGRYGLRLYCSVVENGKEYSFGKLIVLLNSKIDKIIKLNNEGNVL